jgi:hypothetical protein
MVEKKRKKKKQRKRNRSHQHSVIHSTFTYLEKTGTCMIFAPLADGQQQSAINVLFAYIYIFKAGSSSISELICKLMA